MTELKKPFIAVGRTAEEQLYFTENALLLYMNSLRDKENSEIPIKSKMAVSAILRIVKELESPEMKAIKIICEEALYS